MRHLPLALLILAAPVQAFHWPWESPDTSNYAYCKGFVFAGLAAYPVKGVSRTQLWLSWNEAVRAGFAGGVLDPQQYEAGRQQFESLLAASDTNALEELTNGECDLDDSWDL